MPGPIRFLTTSYATWVATGDFNEDGFSDVALTVDFTTQILKGAADGTLSPVAPAFGHAQSTAVIDVDGDGHLDLYTDDDANDQTVWLGAGDGTFSLAAKQPIKDQAILPVATQFAVVDLDGDGDLDVVSANGTSVPTLRLNNGKGDLGPRVYPIAVPAKYPAVAAGDFNGDGTIDLAFTAKDTAEVVVVPGVGKAKFGSPVASPSIETPAALVASDFDHDGHLDLFVSGMPFDDVSTVQPAFMRGNGDGTFASPVTVATMRPSVIQSLLLADFDLDGLADVMHDGETVQRSRGDGTFVETFGVQFDVSAYLFALGDFNGDGKPDVVCAGGSGASVLLNVTTAPLALP